MKPPIEDNQLIDLYISHSQQATAENQHKYAYGHAIARGILAVDEDAEECVNNTWLRA